MSKFHSDEVPDDALKSVSEQLGGWLDQTTAGKFHAAVAGPTPAPTHGAGDTGSTADDAGGEPMPSPPQPAPKPWFAMRETFAVWTLSVEQIEEGLQTGADLVRLAKPTGRWHHQVVCDGKAVGFARTLSESGSGLDVCQLYVSDLAKHIDAAVAWVDEFEEKQPDYAESNPLVLLLYVPSYQTHAFLLVKWLDEGSLTRRLLEDPKADPGGESVSTDVLIIDAPSYLPTLRPQTMLSSRELLEVFRQHEPLGGGLTFAPTESVPPGGLRERG
jgi:hypothetical protein